MDFPILVTAVIIKRPKVDAIVEARQKHRVGLTQTRSI